MQASQILASDILDIIFENRNKAYGAYALRKFYDQEVSKSVGVVILLMAAFAFTVLNSESPDLMHVRPIIHEHGNTTLIQEPSVLKPKDVAKAAKKDARMSNKIVFVDSLLLDSILVDDDHHLATAEGVPVSEPGPSGIMSGGAGTSIPIAPPPPIIPVAPAIDLTKPIEKADIDPSFPGGLKALTKFLERNLENPQELNDGESVSVKVKFVVGYDGELKAFEVKEDGGEAFNKEVIRVLKKMPRWIPGKTDGQNVSVYFTIPVRFITGQ